jgi:hypothetical protein
MPIAGRYGIATWVAFEAGGSDDEAWGRAVFFEHYRLRLAGAVSGRLAAQGDGQDEPPAPHDNMPRVRIAASDFAARMRTRKGTVVDERLIDPQILVTRDFAHVWAPYTLDIDGKRIHCGVDSFGFIKTNGKWLLNSLAWTADPTGCPK